MAVALLALVLAALCLPRTHSRPGWQLPWPGLEPFAPTRRFAFATTLHLRGLNETDELLARHWVVDHSHLFKERRVWPGGDAVFCCTLVQIWAVHARANVSDLVDYLVLHDGTLGPGHLRMLRDAGTIPVRVALPPSAIPYTTRDRVLLMKIWVPNLNYDRVAFLDGDAFPSDSLRHLYTARHSAEYFGVHGVCEPINTGQFLMYPRRQAFEQLYYTLRAGVFATPLGWNRTGRVNHTADPTCAPGPARRKLMRWMFPAAHSDQGLYWFVYNWTRRSAHIVSGLSTNGKHGVFPVIHFAGPKPWSKQPQPSWRRRLWQGLLEAAQAPGTPHRVPHTCQLIYLPNATATTDWAI
eukprot:EG_transcript_14584